MTVPFERQKRTHRGTERAARADGVAQVAEHLPSKPSKPEALSSNPSTTKKKKKKKPRGGSHMRTQVETGVMCLQPQGLQELAEQLEGSTVAWTVSPSEHPERKQVCCHFHFGLPVA
jgi:hypothetical protein